MSFKKSYFPCRGHRYLFLDQFLDTWYYPFLNKILFSSCLFLQIYDWNIYILCSPVLRNSLISPNNLFVDSFGLSSRSHYLRKMAIWFFPFWSQKGNTFSPSPSALARTSSTTLKRNDNRHLCLVPLLKGKVFIISNVILGLLWLFLKLSFISSWSLCVGHFFSSVFQGTDLLFFSNFLLTQTIRIFNFVYCIFHFFKFYLVLFKIC